MTCRWEHAAHRQASEGVRAALRDPWTGEWGHMPPGILSPAETIVWNYDPPTEDHEPAQPAEVGAVEPLPAWSPTQTPTTHPGDPEPEQLGLDSGTAW